jgi:RNA polymerase primary sigma factor
MYMREMGTVELLTREGEIRIAKRIEEGLDQVRSALAQFPPTGQLIFDTYDAILRGETRLQDLITGFIDPNEQIADPSARLPRRRRAPPDEESDDPDSRKSRRHRAGSRGSRRALEEVQALHKRTSRPAEKGVKDAARRRR